MIYKFDVIKKVSKEPIVEQNTARRKGKNCAILEVNYCPGIGDVYLKPYYTYKNRDHAVGLKTVIGGYVSEEVSIGIGLGIDKYKKETVFPISLDVRASMTEENVSPQFIFNAGYALGVDPLLNGLVVNAAFGISTFIAKKTTWFFNIGYRSQGRTFDLPYVTNKNKRVNLSFATFNNGFAF